MFIKTKYRRFFVVLLTIIVCSYLAHVFFEEHTFTTLFRIINFVSLFVLGFYFFKTQGISIIQQKIEDRRELIKKLHQEKIAWNHKKEILSKDIEDQQVVTHDLKDKVLQWNRAFNQQCGQKEQEKKALQQALMAKKIKQSYHADLEVARQQILAQSLCLAQEQLQQKFSSERAGTHFLHEILAYMEKENR